MKIKNNIVINGNDTTITDNSLLSIKLKQN